VLDLGEHDENEIDVVAAVRFGSLYYVGIGKLVS